MSQHLTSFVQQLPALISLGKSVAGALTCQWFPNTCALRYKIGQMGYHTQAHTLVRARSNITVEAAKWLMRFNGAPYDPQAVDTQGKVKSVIAAALIVKPQQGASGKLSLELFNENDQEESTLVFSEKEQPFAGTIMQLGGYDDYQMFDGGFKNGAYPGPLYLSPGDEIQLVTIGTKNFDDPRATISGECASVAGTLTYREQNVQRQQPRVVENYD